MDHSSETATSGQRFALVLEEHFGGNQSRMARETGLSQASIGRIIRGRQVPTLPLVATLAEHHDVNPLWLTTGKGERRLSDVKAAPLERRLPVAKRILSKSPWGHLGHPYVHEIAVVPSVYAASRYGLEIQHDDPAVREPDERLRAGDVVIFETDPTFWQADLQRLRGKLVAVRLQHTKGVSRLLGHADCEFGPPDEPCFFVNVFGVGRVPLELGSGTTAPEDTNTNIDEDQGKERRPIQIDKTPPGGARRKAPSEAQPEFHRVTATVIAVGIHLLRNL